MTRLILFFFPVLFFFYTGHTPFSAERAAGQQTNVLRRAARSDRSRQQETAFGTERAAGCGGGQPAETVGAGAVAVFAGPTAFRQDGVGRVDGGPGRPGGPPATTAATPVRHRRRRRRRPRGGVARQRPAVRRPRRRRQQDGVAADIAHAAQPVAQGGGEGRVRAHARPDRVPGDEPGRDQVRGETQRQLQTGERHEPAARLQVAQHADGAAQGPQR